MDLIAQARNGFAGIDADVTLIPSDFFELAGAFVYVKAKYDRYIDIRNGVTVDDVTYAPIEARLEREQGSNVWIAMSLTEGKNREVKRVMEHLGLDVTRLIRVSYGPFQLGDLPEGAIEEVKLKVLRDQLGKSLAELAGVDFSSPLREATPAEATPYTIIAAVAAISVPR